MGTRPRSVSHGRWREAIRDLATRLLASRGEKADERLADAEGEWVVVRAQRSVLYYVELRKFGELAGEDREWLQAALKILVDQRANCPPTSRS